MRSTWLALGAGLCGFALVSIEVEPVARIAVALALLVALLVDGRRALVLAAAVLGSVSGARIDPPLVLEDTEPSALVRVVAVLDAPIRDGRSRGWIRTPGHGPLRARIAGLEGESAGAGTRVVGTARLRDLNRRATPDRRAAGRSAAARRDQVGVSFREARIVRRAPAGRVDRWAGELDRRLGVNAGLWRALSVADADALDPGARAMVQRLGMAHLLALSGMHTAIVAGALLWPWRRRGRRALVFVLPVLVGWVLVAGAGPSLVRAVAMAAWWVVARQRGDRSDVVDGLAAIALLELAVRPQLLCGVGWWLSYAATLAVIRSATATRAWPRPVSAIAVSGSAQLATLPWVLDAFGFVNLIAPVTLLLVGPVFGLALTVGLGAVVTGSVLPWLSPWTDVLAIAGGHLFGFALRVVVPFSDWTLRAPGLEGATWAASLAAVFLVGWPSRLTGRWRLLLALPLLVVASFDGPAAHEWILFDVGQGDGAVYRCGDEALVLDAGPHYGSAAPASWTLVDWVRRRDAAPVSVAITHGHLDHFGGLGSLIGAGLVGEVFLARADSGRGWTDRVVRASRGAGVSIRWVERGDTLRVGHCRLAVEWPPPEGGALHSNDRSIVLTWDLAGSKALSAGDLERVGERRLVRRAEYRWLKVAHHGGDTGTEASFLESIAPARALVSCGAGNRYGHPDPAVIQRLEVAGAEVHRTDQCGYLRVSWSSPGKPERFDCGHGGCP